MADNKLPFALSFERQYAGPLDPTTVFETYAELEHYVYNNNTAYNGQICFAKTGSMQSNAVSAYQDIPPAEIISVFILAINPNDQLLRPVFMGEVFYIEDEILFESSSHALGIHMSDYATNHSKHKISHIIGLQTALDAKAEKSHTHTIANVTNLQTTLNGKAATAHTHEIANVTGLQTALNAKAATAHTHSIANVTNLQAALEGKAALSHPHTIANVTDLQPLLTEQTNNIDYLLWLVDKLKRWSGFTYPDPAEQPYFGDEMIMIIRDPAKQISINNLLDWHKMKLGIVTWGPTNFSPNFSMNMYGSYTGSMINNNFTVVITVMHHKLADPWKSTDEVNVYPFENMIGIAHCKSLECVVKETSDAGASVGLVCYNIFGAGQNAYPTTMQQCNEVNESSMIVNPNDLYTSSYYSDSGKLPVASSIRLQFKSSPTLHATLAESRVRTFIIQGTMLNN